MSVNPGFAPSHENIIQGFQGPQTPFFQGHSRTLVGGLTVGWNIAAIITQREDIALRRRGVHAASKSELLCSLTLHSSSERVPGR